MPDLERELLERRGDERRCCEQLGVAIALEDLRRARCGLKAEPLAGGRSNSGSVAEYVPTAPESFPTRMPSSARSTRSAVALELERPAGELETERGRLGVHAVRAADHERVAVLLGPSSGDCRRTVDAVEDGRPRLEDLGESAVSSTSEEVRP